MEAEASLWVQPLKLLFIFLFFSFTISFSFFSIMIFILRVKPWCNCELCRSYLTSSWSTQFDNLSDWFTHLLQDSPTGTIHIHITGNTITANPDNVEHMLKTKFDNYPKGKTFSTILKDLLGHGIFNVDGEVWRFQRKMASLELGSLSVRSYISEIVTDEIKNRLLPLMASVSNRNSHQLDLQDIFGRFAFDSICRISFGLDPGCLDLSLPVPKFATAFDLASKLLAQRGTSVSPWVWKTKRLLNIGSERKLREAIKMIDALAEEMIRQRRKMGFAGRGDLLSRFMGSVDDDDDDKFLRDIVISFLLAGRDTIAAALTSFFWLLANHPEVESKIREEASLYMDEEEDVADLEQLKSMQYLHAAVYESLRLYPPVQFDSKFASEDDVLPDGTSIKKGSRVTFHPYAMGRMTEIWGKDCFDFKPERWLKKGVFQPESLFKYPVFQAGVRVCLGKDMAVLEIKSVAVALVRMFKIEICDPGQKPMFLAGLTASLKGGLPVKVRALEETPPQV